MDLAILGIKKKSSGSQRPAPPDYPGLKPPAAPEPDADDQGGPSDNDADDTAIKPEWVLYHDDKEVCSTCEYMQGDQCSVLKMPVPPGGHCEAHEQKGTGEPSAPSGPSTDDLSAPQS